MNALAYIRMVETTVLDESHVYIESLILEVFNTPSELLRNFVDFLRVFITLSLYMFASHEV